MLSRLYPIAICAFLISYEAGLARAACEEALVKDALGLKYRQDIRTAVLNFVNENNFSSANKEGQLGILIPELDLPADAKFKDLASKQQSFSQQYGYSFSDIRALDFAATRQR